ncbi:MAG: energy transducer TonB [Tannerella sp.]|uniref:energy transducer TonB n=1 Tax=uncultured Coprobacter sp. TaxID=1720550 RepID=UPI002626E32C|nr:energy transducer TonB [uncultured Coprobacter sp.]MBS6267744.1 energy transducer TonB [Tannerella sp.]
MKTIFIMGILSFFCGISAAQPQYWGEGAYDLENVVFGMNVDKYYSKAKPYDGYPDESFRYFGKDKKICKTKKGKKAVIYQYSSIETNYGEVLARFGNFEFPYTGMLADKSGKLIGILAQGRLDGTAAVDSLLYALAEKYGQKCYMTEEYFGERNFGWYMNDRTIQLYVCKPVPEHLDAVIYLEENEKGERKIVGGGSQPHTWYEVRLTVTKTKYDPFIDCIEFGDWMYFNDLLSDVRSMEINPTAGIYDTGELFTEEDLVPDTIKGYMNIPDGELPKFKEGPFAKFPDFRLAVRHWMAYNAGLGNQGNPEGNVSVSFTVGKDGKAKDAKVENRETTSSELEVAALYTIQRLPEFIPATQNGKPVAFRMTVALRFENR